MASDDLTAIENVRQRWIASLNERNVEDFVSCCTPDVVWIPPDGSLFEGHEAIANWLPEPFMNYEFDYSVSEIKIRFAENRAIEEGSFVSKVRPVGTDEWLSHTGEYLLVWRNDDGNWAIELYLDRGAEYEHIE